MTIDEKHQAVLALQHAMQSGVAAVIERHGYEDPKHTRVGINSAMVEHASLVRLLIDKGIITEDEYLDALIVTSTEEKERYEARLSAELGSKVTLV